jgi:hypothetical protein
VSSTSCRGVVRLPDWQRSSGARMEVAIAEAFGKKVWDYEDLIHGT